MPTRRSVLIGAGVVASSSLAGCSGLMDSDGPEDAVETYINAGNEGDFEAANEVLHPESTSYPIEEGDLPDEVIELAEAEEASLEDAIRWQAERFDQELDGDELGQAVEQRREEIEEELEGIGADDYTFVRVLFTDDSTEDETYVVVVEDGGEWLVYF